MPPSARHVANANWNHWCDMPGKCQHDHDHHHHHYFYFNNFPYYSSYDYGVTVYDYEAAPTPSECWAWSPYRQHWVWICGPHHPTY
jgi:hypothetical protein